MEKGQVYIVAAAIVVAGLIVAGAILAVGRSNQNGRYVFGNNSNGLILDTRTGELWGRAPSLGDGPWQRMRYLE
jgi:hypothetical protein